MPLRKVHELTFLWFRLPGPLLKKRINITSIKPRDPLWILVFGVFEQEAPQNRNPDVLDQRGVRESLHVEFALNNRELVKAEVFKKRVFEQRAPLK